METASSNQTRLLYNPQLQSAEMAEKLFVVRQKQFTFLLNNILKEKENSIPQHYLIIGQRGMGKTTILKRIEVELHKEEYRKHFIPLLFREEQYRVQDLAEFWLNSLDALADSLACEKDQADMVANIDKTIQDLLRKPSTIISEEVYGVLMDLCHSLDRRPVLLIDNIDIVFSGLDSNNKSKQEQWALRKLLSENGAPIIIGGGVTTTDDVAKYEMPFYDFFKIQYLKKLDYEEFVKLLNNLASVTNSDATVFTAIQQNTSRQKALLELTGGSPRLTVMLFDQISQGSSTNINDDLNILADAITPLYKAKFEELSQQQRIILDAIALNWDAISLRKLAIETRMKNNQLSPQLKRLIDDGWIETTSAYKDKGNAYFISERFFNIYYLIRNSSRRHKDRIYCLSKFLEYSYEKEEPERILDTVLEQNIYSSEQIPLYFERTAELSHSIDVLEAAQNENKSFVSHYYLNKTIFELDNQNKGLAKESLLQAFEVLEKEDKLAAAANQYWLIQFGSNIIKKECGPWLLAVLEEKGYDIVLSPYYTAIQALEIERQNSKNSKKDAEIYLKNRAVEISEPARTLIEKMRKYMD